MPSRYPDAVSDNSLITPTLSMRPVNIAFDQDIRPKLLNLPLDQRRRGEQATVEQWHALPPEPHRSHVELDVVHDAFVPRRLVHQGATFEHKTLHVEVRQHRERGGHSRPGHRNHASTGALEGLGAIRSL